MKNRAVFVFFVLLFVLGSIVIIISNEGDSINLEQGKNKIILNVSEPFYVKSLIKLNPDIEVVSYEENGESKGYVNINENNQKSVDLSKLNIEKLKILFQIFISRERNDEVAIKWRFYQYIKYIMELKLKTVKINIDPNPDLVIDFIIETEEKEIILALCCDILELDNYKNALKKIKEFTGAFPVRYHEKTAGGCDISIDCAGVPITIRQALEVLKPETSTVSNFQKPGLVSGWLFRLSGASDR